MCADLGIEPTTFACYHRNHINNFMYVAVTAFAFKDSVENGGDAVKLGFVRAQQYKISDRLVISNTDTNYDGSSKVVREKDDLWPVDCAVTGSSICARDKPRFPLKEYFQKTIFLIVEELVLSNGKYAGYNQIFQGDNYGSHEEE